MLENKEIAAPMAVTTYKIGKTTYVVKSLSSKSAVDSLKEKIEKLILKNIRQSAGKMGEEI